MPASETQRRRHRERLARHASALERRSLRFSRVRLGVVVVGAVVAFLLFRSGASAAGFAAAAAFVGAFAFIVKRHDRVEVGLAQTRRLEHIKDLHERRRALDWDALPEAWTGAKPDPVAADLNLVGPRSFHHLVDTCATEGGSRHLGEWLTDPEPTHETVAERQALVRQLAALELFRDRLARTSPTGRWDDAGLRRWLNRTEIVPNVKPWVAGLTAFAAVNVLLVLAHVFGWLPALWPVSILIYFAVYFMKYRSVDDVFEEAQELDLTLAKFMPPVLYLERFHFPEGTAAHRATSALRAAAPSHHLKRLARIAAFSAATRHELMWLLLNLLLPWELLFTYFMHRAKRALRRHLPAWLDTWHRLEAAAALAAYADRHERRVFPDVRPATDPPVFEGRGLGHPLLREDVKVRNDFTAPDLGEVVLITGSNMSGKSTFLRTLGINLRLAYAGAPVDAASLRATCFRVFTSINVVDSVQEGLSHFYAEVQRLKALLDALSVPDALPMFNLIDEIFRGTNNRERLIGSRAFVRELAGRSAVSFISTHDLELTALEEEIGGLRNFHFREDVSGDRMTFDYTLRPGPCPTTNALKIMARAGLPVGSDGVDGRQDGTEKAVDEGRDG